jgi:hypothetical protein
MCIVTLSIVIGRFTKRASGSEGSLRGGDDAAKARGAMQRIANLRGSHAGQKLLVQIDWR